MNKISILIIIFLQTLTVKSQSGTFFSIETNATLARVAQRSNNQVKIGAPVGGGIELGYRINTSNNLYFSGSVNISIRSYGFFNQSGFTKIGQGQITPELTLGYKIEMKKSRALDVALAYNQFIFQDNITYNFYHISDSGIDTLSRTIVNSKGYGNCIGLLMNYNSKLRSRPFSIGIGYYQGLKIFSKSLIYKYVNNTPSGDLSVVSSRLSYFNVELRYYFRKLKENTHH